MGRISAVLVFSRPLRRDGNMVPDIYPCLAVRDSTVMRGLLLLIIQTNDVRATQSLDCWKKSLTQLVKRRRRHVQLPAEAA